jgi:mono/diheme cytochrome c family protein
MGLPEALVQRSAEARAAETGGAVEDILAAWAGGETVDTAPVSEPDSGAAETVEAGPEEAGSEVEEPEPEPETPAPAAEAPPPVVAAPSSAPAASPTRAPVPTEVTVAQAAHLPEVITVPTAGIKERTNFVIPRWLTSLLLVAPLVALFSLGGSATGACGEATELAIDVISGEIVNCDGSAFTAGGPGGGGSDFVAMGGELYAGAVTPAATCTACHGPNGQGTAAFPALTGVLTTFGACADHIEWVRLGSAGYAAEGTYGDTNKPVQNGMPSHGSLTDEQLASVAAFERVRFGGANPEETLVDCGLAEPDSGEAPGGGEGDGGDTTGSSIPTEGEGDPETSASPSD